MRAQHEAELAAHVGQVVVAIERMHQALADQASSTLNAIRERGCHVAALPDAGVTGFRPTTVANTLLGWSLFETSDAASATIRFLDGRSIDRAVVEVARVDLAPGESTRDWFGPGGLSLVEGLVLDVVAGDVGGAVYLGSG